jgi:chromate reductase
VVELKAWVHAADSMLFVTPEYNCSIPGVLKNAIDRAPRPHGDNARDANPVAVIGASIGMLGTARPQYHLRQSFVFLNMYPLNRPEEMIANTGSKFDEQGNFRDEKGKELIRLLLIRLVEWTRVLRSILRLEGSCLDSAAKKDRGVQGLAISRWRRFSVTSRGKENPVYQQQ